MKRWLATPAAKSAIFFTASQNRGLARKRLAGALVAAKRGRLRHFVHHLLDRREQRKLSAHRALHHPAGDDQPVDLVRSFKDAVDARIAIGALRRILLNVAVAAHRRNQFIGHQREHLRSVDLQNGTLDGVFLDAARNINRLGLFARRLCRPYSAKSRINQPRRAIGHGFGCVELRRSRGDLALDQAKLRDCFAECVALLGVADHARQRVPRAADAGNGQLEPAHVEHVECDVMALAGLAQQILFGNFAILQHQRAGGGAANSQLVFFSADGEPRRVALDQKCRKFFAVPIDTSRRPCTARRCRSW